MAPFTLLVPSCLPIAYHLPPCCSTWWSGWHCTNYTNNNSTTIQFALCGKLVLSQPVWARIQGQRQVQALAKKRKRVQRIAFNKCAYARWTVDFQLCRLNIHRGNINCIQHRSSESLVRQATVNAPTNAVQTPLHSPHCNALSRETNRQTDSQLSCASAAIIIYWIYGRSFRFITRT